MGDDNGANANNRDGDGNGEHYFVWLSDIHFDPYYSTPQAYTTRYYAEANCNSDDASLVSNYGCDSSRTLVKSALEYAAKVASDRPPAFVIITGDSIRHGVDELFAEGDFHEGSESRGNNTVGANLEVQDAADSPYHSLAMKEAGSILNDVVVMVQEAFPDTQIIYSIGNNDVVPDYYLQLQNENSPLGSADLIVEEAGMLGIIYNALIDGDSNNSTTLAEEEGPKQHERTAKKAILTADDEWTFLRGGYYSRNLHDGKLTVLSLNTILYSSYFSPTLENADDPGWQFQWMRKMLRYCRERGSRAVIIGHIPPAVGSFRHTQLCMTQYVQTYYEIVKEFDDVIIAQLYGHLHSDEFRVGITDENESMSNISMLPTMSTPLLLAGSITPLHGNNPSIRLVKYGQKIGDGSSTDNTGKYRMLDYESHRYSLGAENEWSKLYTFSESYSAASDIVKDEGLSSNAFRAIFESMEDKIGKESLALESYRSVLLSGADGDGVGGVGGRGANVACDMQCRGENLCTIISATRPGYDNCLLERQQTWPQSGRGIFGMVGVALFGTVLIVFLAMRFCRRRSHQDNYDSTPSVDSNVKNEETESRDQEMI